MPDKLIRVFRKNHAFEVATANQCFLYFDQEQTIATLRRMLVPGGRLVLSHYNWLPKIDPIAGATEELILKFNSSWDAAGFDGRIAPIPEWVPSDIVLEGFFSRLSRLVAKLPNRAHSGNLGDKTL